MNRRIRENFRYFALFPCWGGTKIPSTKHGFKDAKYDQDIEKFVERGINIGIACKESGIAVIDLDYHNEDSMADEELAKLEEELGSKLPRTLTQTTASGKGRHLIFSNRGLTNPKGKIGDNIEFKTNGFIMAAYSVVNGRQYEIIDGIDEDGNFIIADLPKPWLDYLNKPAIKHSPYYIRNNTNTEKPLPIELKDSDIDKMFEGCAFLRHCKDDAAFLSEPEWFSMVSLLASIKNAETLIHTLSSSYPNYSYQETQYKIKRAQEFGRGHTCAYISSICPEICSQCSKTVQMKGNF